VWKSLAVRPGFLSGSHTICVSGRSDRRFPEKHQAGTDAKTGRVPRIGIKSEPATKSNISMRLPRIVRNAA
jgi:hypothetical protein